MSMTGISISSTLQQERKDATCFVNNLDDRVTEDILWELFIQCAPVVNVKIPKDRVTLQRKGMGFVEMLTEADAEYAIRILNNIKLFDRQIRVQRNMDKQMVDIGANLFVRGLAPEVDEYMLRDAFSQFGTLSQTPRIGRDPEGMHKGYAFVSYTTFEAADAAIAAMNGEFFANRTIKVEYSLKKDSKTERHGSTAERLLARSIQQGAEDGTSSRPSPAGGSMVLPSSMSAGLVQPAMAGGFPGAAPPGAGGMRHSGLRRRA
ncbi:hypothetical protein H696_02816 [Fonticula alba]|uniref:RRM domain-containing protein n=1 Tax=Fonticula alba TaxID=691883 RepID=A0A058Z8B9_FONAL|nr:hypothetical protein H696_02816 [Fonticula alba]KCV70475.1 hypothetical protein H696_02816 [Fonticula alba]|eukprot:XP_009494991.1 hypothetical protein H696_02816 [Fonticula alba]